MFVAHHLVFVMQVKPRKALIPQIVRRLSVKTCICGCGKPEYRNGLSRKCHYAHEKDMYALAPDDRAAFVSKRIRRGLWLTAALRRLLKTEAAKASAR